MNFTMVSQGSQQKINLGELQIKATQERTALTSDKESEVASATNNGDKVSISAEGLEKQTDEVNGVKEKNTPTDQAIAQIKEQIERVKQQLEALQGDDSPEGKDKRKILQGQLGELTTALLSAIDEKLKEQQKKMGL